jgi:ribonuclease Z
MKFPLSLLLAIALSISSCQKLMETAVKRQMSKSRAEMLTDGNLHVVLVGSGGPMPNPERISGSVAVIAGGEFILVDTGPGAARNAGLQNLPMGKLTAVFFTHFHSDHIGDLGEVNMYSWVQGRKKALDVYGPPGVDKIVDGFALAYSLDFDYRTAHHGETVAPTSTARPKAITITAENPEQATLFFEKNGLKVFMFKVDHSPVSPAVGYRFEYRGKVVVISGDTVKTKTLAHHARDADIFICEALDTKAINLAGKIATEINRPRIAKIMTDIPDYHMTPVQAAEVAKEAGAKKLVFVHIVPPLTNFLLERMYLEGVDEVFNEDVELGEDGMTFTLSAE